MKEGKDLIAAKVPDEMQQPFCFSNRQEPVPGHRSLFFDHLAHDFTAKGLKYALLPIMVIIAIDHKVSASFPAGWCSWSDVLVLVP